MVRDTKTPDERIESTRGSVMSPQKPRARRRSFVHAYPTIANPDVTDDVVARADADFERIFGSE